MCIRDRHEIGLALMPEALVGEDACGLGAQQHLVFSGYHRLGIPHIGNVLGHFLQEELPKAPQFIEGVGRFRYHCLVPLVPKGDVQGLSLIHI